MIDIVGEGFDAALRIASLPDSSLIAQKLCNVELLLVAAPSYLKSHGRPTHPLHLAEHNCFTYFPAGDTWRFTSGKGETASVKPRGDLSANNGDAFLPSLIAGLGIARLPDFIVREALAQKTLETLLPEWSSPSAALHWVTPPGGHRPARVEALARFFAERLRDEKPA
jgi:DNA-binding transcriptional LysR family regulator